MVRGYRGSWEIMMCILESCSGEGAKKTHVMYRANLNYVSFAKYFVALVEKGLIREVEGTNGDPLFRITEKGSALVKVLRQAKGSIPSKK